MIEQARNWWRRQVVDVLVRVDRDYRRDAARYRHTVLPISIVIVLVLTLNNYVWQSALATRWLAERLGNEYAPLAPYAYWALSRVWSGILIPIVLIRFVVMPQVSLTGWGLTCAGFGSHIRLIGVLYAIMLPVVYGASTAPAFQETYPFYRQAQQSAGHFLFWELTYVVQFFSSEFFYRGFIVHTLKRALGCASLGVMLIPYCMVHFGKPFPETLGSVVAGLVLGFLSLRTGSIWPGFVLHASVACTMDAFCLWQTGGFSG